MLCQGCPPTSGPCTPKFCWWMESNWREDRTLPSAPPPSSSQLSSRVPGCPNKIDPSGPTPPAWGPRATAASKFGVSALNCGILMDFFFFQHTCERLFVFAGPGACQLLGCDGELPASFQQPSHSPPPLLCPIPGGWWETGHCQGWPLWAHSAPAMCQGSHCLPQLDS